MALVECKNCGLKIYDWTDKCPRCGCTNNIKLMQQEQQHAREISNMKRNTVIVVSVLSTALVLVLALMLYLAFGRGNATSNTPDTIRKVVTVETQEQPAAAADAPAPEAATSAPQEHVVRPASANYAGSLGAQAGNTYYASNMLDGKPSTAWAVTLESDDVLYGPTITFAQPTVLTKMNIRNGYQKDSYAYNNNTRAGYVTIVDAYNGIEIGQGRLSDSKGWQTVRIDYSQPVRAVRLDFSGFYWGQKYSDLCVSDVQFYGK